MFEKDFTSVVKICRQSLIHFTTSFIIQGMRQKNEKCVTLFHHNHNILHLSK